MEQRIGEARIAEFACLACQDTGIQHGSTDINDQRVLLLRPCMDCDARNKEVPNEPTEPQARQHSSS